MLPYFSLEGLSLPATNNKISKQKYLDHIHTKGAEAQLTRFIVLKRKSWFQFPFRASLTYTGCSKSEDFRNCRPWLTVYHKRGLVLVLRV